MKIQGNEHPPHEITGIKHEPVSYAERSALQSFLCQDLIDISAGQLELDQLVAQAKATQDVRMDRVDAIRRQLASGSYRVDADRVAERLIDGMLERGI